MSRIVNRWLPCAFNSCRNIKSSTIVRGGQSPKLSYQYSLPSTPRSIYQRLWFRLLLVAVRNGEILRYYQTIGPIKNPKLNASLSNAIVLREHLYNLRFVDYEINIRQIQQPVELPLLLDEFRPSPDATELVFHQARRISSSRRDSDVCLTDDNVQLHTFKRCQL